MSRRFRKNKSVAPPSDPTPTVQNPVEDSKIDTIIGSIDGTIKNVSKMNNKIGKLEEKTENLKEFGKEISSMGKVLKSLDKIIQEKIELSNLPEEWKKGISAIWEYVGLFIVSLFSISAAFGYFSFDNFSMEDIVKLALVLSSTILLGAIKSMLWKQIQQRDKTIEDLKSEMESNKIALNITSKENLKLQNEKAEILAQKAIFETQYKAIIINAKRNIPNFDPEAFQIPKMA
jgi:DNA repair exonuclease SbcCD ATPase subunit